MGGTNTIVHTHSHSHPHTRSHTHPHSHSHSSFTPCCLFPHQIRLCLSFIIAAAALVFSRQRGHRWHFPFWEIALALVTHSFLPSFLCNKAMEGSSDSGGGVEREQEQGEGSPWSVFWRQLTTVLWKNWLLKKRKWPSTLFAVVVPTVIFCILVVIRGQIPASDVSAGA